MGRGRQRGLHLAEVVGRPQLHGRDHPQPPLLRAPLAPRLRRRAVRHRPERAHHAAGLLPPAARRTRLEPLGAEPPERRLHRRIQPLGRGARAQLGQLRRLALLEPDRVADAQPRAPLPGPLRARAGGRLHELPQPRALGAAERLRLGQPKRLRHRLGAAHRPGERDGGPAGGTGRAVEAQRGRRAELGRKPRLAALPAPRGEHRGGRHRVEPRRVHGEPLRRGEPHAVEGEPLLLARRRVLPHGRLRELGALPPGVVQLDVLRGAHAAADPLVGQELPLLLGDAGGGLLRGRILGDSRLARAAAGEEL